ncbi:3-deoxy-D-manno-octulosonic acid transferase [Desulfobulbus sp. TB]|nr:3-deoxy-D-manno-octulosonic acid transferase [Desulfobulbus sp. TB]
MILAMYNGVLMILGLLLLPVLFLIILSRKKYQGSTLERLGLKRKKRQEALNRAGESSKKNVIWIHALSVGEVTSALPLIREFRAFRGLRTNRVEPVIVLTVGTASGKKTAEKLIGSSVHCILSSPFDFRFAIQRYITDLQPDIFIQVETDFWPNWLSLLRKNNVPTMLVNGRISEKSFVAYQRFALFFRPMFCSFDLLAMQTQEDCRKMTRLGVPAARIIALGNLKYDMKYPSTQELARTALPLPVHLPVLAEKGAALIWVCGSTHSGEEKIIFSAVAQFLARKDQQKVAQQLVLVLAPRDINRGQELVALAGSFGLKAGLRSRNETEGRVLILDTLGELALYYSQADLAFVGGSLVPQGGHNPIEPALYGVPVLFGPSMEDFAEIAHDLLDCAGGKTVTADSLAATVAALLVDKQTRILMGQAAHALVQRHRGGVQRHIEAIKGLLSKA